MPEFEDKVGWATVEGLMTLQERRAVLDASAELLGLPPEQRWAGDKPNQGTKHLTNLDERIPVVAEVLTRSSLTDVVADILGPHFALSQASYRNPQPGFGGQKLHADDLHKLDQGPNTVATALVSLVDFTPTNGATRIVPGSHRRPDLQRRAGSLDRHDEEILLTGSAGTAFVFSGHLLHSGTVNHSSDDRPALQLLWRAR